jgi:RNA polymerase sigma-70 factor, ECF subfamily
VFLSGKKYTTDSSDEQLMQGIAAGNRNAFCLLYDRYFDKLCWYACGFVKDAAAAEDAVQECFMQLIEKPAEFDSSKRFSTWIYTLVANRCKNQLRNATNRQRLLAEQGNAGVHSPNWHRQLDGQLVRAKVEKILEEATDKERSLYQLRFEQDLSIREIAEILQIPEGSVKSGLYYMLKKMNTPLMRLMYEK